MEIALDQKHGQRSDEIGGVHVSGRVGLSGEKGFRKGFSNTNSFSVTHSVQIQIKIESSREEKKAILRIG